MADKTFDILIDIEARVQAIDGAIQKIQALNKETTGVGSAFEGVLKGIQLGLGIDLVNLVREIPLKLREAVEEGIRFNAFLESANIGVAGMLRQFEPERYKDFQSALGDSGQLIDLLRSKANLLGLSFEAMVEQYRTTAGALFAGGVVDLQKQVDLTVLLQQAVGALGITGFQAQRDIFDLIEGRASRTIAGKALGVSDEDVQRAKDAGQLYEFLTQKFGALSESGKVLGTTFSAAEQRAKNLFEQLLGIATKDFFGEAKKGLDELNAGLAQEKTAETIRGIEAAVIGIGKGGAEGVDYLAQKFKQMNDNMEAALHTGEALQFIQTKLLGGGVFGSDIDLAHARQLVDYSKQLENSLLGQIRSATTVQEKKAAEQILSASIDAAQERVTNSTGETRYAAESLLRSLEGMRNVFPDIVGSAEKTARAMQASADAIKQAIKSTETLQSVQSQIAQNQAIARGDEAGAQEIDFQNLYKETFNKLFPPGTADPTGDKALAAAKEAKDLVDSARQRAIYEDSIKTSSDGERDARRDITNLLREDSALLKGLQAQQKLISENPTLGVDDKQSLLGSNAIAQQQEIALAIQKTGDALKDAFGSGNQDQIIQLQSRLAELQVRFTELGFTIQQSFFGGSLKKSLADWVNGFGTAGQQIGTIIQGTVNASLQGTNQLLIGAVLHTGNWRQTLVGVEQQILNLFLTWIEQMALQKAAQLLGITATTTAQVASGGAVAAAHGPAAAATSISSYGAAAIIGEVLAVAAIAAIIAALSGGFEAGGYTGDGDISSVAGVVHRGEFVIPADVTRQVGVPNLNNLVSIGRQRGYLDGGFVDGGSSSGSSGGPSRTLLPDINVWAVLDMDELRHRLFDHPLAANYVVNMVNRASRS